MITVLRGGRRRASSICKALDGTSRVGTELGAPD